MRCIFCKQNSSETKSIEHIIPESLGNKSFVLPKGYVCDKCNNYFSHEIERPFLEQMNIRLLRFEEAIPNKKNKIPPINGAIGNDKVTVHKKINNSEVAIELELSPEQIIKLMIKNGPSKIILPAFDNNILPPQNSITSRFIAKIAFEALSVKIKDDQEWIDFLIDNPQFNAIRNHVRLGTTKDWPCSIRRIYNADKLWSFEQDDDLQVIHESDFLLPNLSEGLFDQCGNILSEIYFIVVLWGIEYAINIGGPEIDGYKKWLADHNNISPLYYGKNKNFTI